MGVPLGFHLRSTNDAPPTPNTLNYKAPGMSVRYTSDCSLPGNKFDAAILLYVPIALVAPDLGDVLRPIRAVTILTSGSSTRADYHF